MRLFIAINFNDYTLARLLSLRDDLRAQSKQGNFSRPENLHLTLAFLGECDEKQTSAAKMAVKATEFNPLPLTIYGLGNFGQKKNGDPSLVYALAEKTIEIARLQEELYNNLTSKGLRPDSKKFVPHITLGRNVVYLDNTVNGMFPKFEPFSETVGIIDLMKSERIGGKLTYTSIYRKGKWLNPIVVEPYSPQWQTEFERIKSYLLPFVSELSMAIHHVGSTSVPGLAAKPIIDIDIEIPSYDVFPKVCEQLEKAGWRHGGDYGIEKREAFKSAKPLGFMEHHLYVCPSDSAELRRHLAFRDYLRSHKEAAFEYGELKQSLAKKHINDIGAYIDGKSAFIQSVLIKAIKE